MMRVSSKPWVWSGAVLALIIAVWMLVLAPLMAWRTESAQARVAAESDLLEMQDRVSGLRASLESRLAEPATAPTIALEAREPVYTATLEFLTSATVEADLELRALTETRASNWQDYPALGFRLEVEGGYDRIIDLVRSIEDGEDTLLFDRANIRFLPSTLSAGEQPRVLLQLDLLALHSEVVTE